MKRHTYKEAGWWIFEATGWPTGEKVKGIFTDVRIDPTTVPEGKYMYECRHSDTDWATPITIEESVVVNFCGTLITDKELKFSDCMPIKDVKYD